MKKNLMSLLLTLPLFACANADFSSRKQSEPSLPNAYKTPYQEAVKHFERSNRPSSEFDSRRPYFG